MTDPNAGKRYERITEYVKVIATSNGYGSPKDYYIKKEKYVEVRDE